MIPWFVSEIKLMNCSTQILRLEKRKKPDPLKTSILQPLRDANFLGPSRLQD
jgi:hypothetical protein